MSAPVRYRPADVLRWLELGAGSLREHRKSSEDSQPGLRSALMHAAGRVLDLGKSAVADAGRRALQQLEYRLYEDRVEAAGAASVRSVAYKDVLRIEALKRGGCRVVASTGTITIKPYAWLTVSGVRVPLGWERNGMDVPFELLIEELAARTKAPVKQV